MSKKKRKKQKLEKKIQKSYKGSLKLKKDPQEILKKK